MIVWTVLPIDVECGYCSGLVVAGQPIAHLTVTRKYRCRDCARVAVDYTQVEAARQALEERQREQAHPTQLKCARPTPRVSAPRPPQPLSAIAGGLFDPKSAAANDRDEE